MEFEEIGKGPRGLIAQTNQTPPSDLWLPPGEIVTSLFRQGDPVATGWAPLDNRCRRGGVPPGRVVCWGGPPFTGKTTILADAAVHMSKTVPVFGLFQDEGRAQAAVRIGVMLGLEIDEIEEHPEIAGPKLTELMEERSIFLLKPESDEACADYVFRYAAERCAGSTGVVILDSVQTVRAFSEEARDERSGIRAIMKLCRRSADEFGLIVLLGSQSPRGFYRSRKTEEKSVSLAAFLGDSSIEYLSDVVVTLSIPEKGSEIVECETPKNRLRPFKKTNPPYSTTWSVKYDHAVGRLLEVDSQVQDEERISERDRKKQEKQERWASEKQNDILKVLGKAERLPTRGLVREVGGKVETLLGVLEAMARDGLIESEVVKGKGGSSIFWCLKKRGN